MDSEIFSGGWGPRDTFLFSRGGVSEANFREFYFMKLKKISGRLGFCEYAFKLPITLIFHKIKIAEPS